MATQEYKIKYRDRRIQHVTADSYGVYGDWFVFSVDKEDVLRIAANEVEGVAHSNVPDPKSPAPVIA